MTSYTPDSSSNDFETLYRAAINSDEVGGVARDTAQKVVERFFENKNDGQLSDLTAQIQEAAGDRNIDRILKLTEELKRAKDTEHERAMRLVKFAEEFTFQELLQAFPSDFKDLAYEIGLLVIQHTQQGIAKSKRRGGSASGSRRVSRHKYLISRGDQTIEAVSNVGSPKKPGAEREFFEFMGFTVSEDGRSLQPPTFVNIKGETVTIVSKKAVIEDLMAGHDAWLSKGYSIKVQEQTPEPSGA
ncbi:hypothetical protein DV532_27955 (plasmid) [Pseudomonas sp. Leaf58]|uniref:hypothetical protein n=1 Tax=Pseudomonas sp. Leaf58 TaxID=1736226 RepID=UPI0006F3F8B7|nr:hypothetical protein [Pseudomonas sp. Leaf58]AYG48116.1 hypothetical protein DV532_27955 [Pseudomonas sp. Leaf58]KQN62330.1 hypothetical protein ASF02_09265 [Pseudomonas sp. Leaf58]